MAGKERFPAIVTPRSLPPQQRDVQLAVQSIKERIEALEAAHDLLAATSSAGIFALKTASVAGSASTTTTTTYTAAAALVLPSAVILQGATTVVPADPTIPSQTFGCFGVAVSSAPGVGTASPGQTVQVATVGQVISLTQTFVAFQPVFCGPNGQLTQMPAPGVSAIIQVGVAIAPQLMLVAPAAVIISGTSILGAVDNFLASTDTIWQFNGVQVAARRIADFVAAAGFLMTVTDDPGSNRVVITLGATVNPFSAQLVEDGWPWGNPDGLVDDEWELWQADSFANSSTVTPSVLLSLEDAWRDPDDVTDEWDWWINEVLPRSMPALVLSVEDGWHWFFDDVAEEWETWQFDSFANPSTVVGSAVLSVEDGWLAPDDTHDDTLELVLSSTTGWNQNG